MSAAGEDGPGATPKLRVAVAGASGRMGQEVLRALAAAPDLALAGAVSRGFAGPGRAPSSPLEVDLASRQVPTFAALADCLEAVRPAVLVEFTTAEVAPRNLRAALSAGVRPVSGTTGIPPAELGEIDAAARQAGLGGVVIPNFSLGATVLSLLARTAAPYFSAAEIVELHHDQKRDAPSGTALALARVLGANLRQGEGAGAAASAADNASQAAAGHDAGACPARYPRSAPGRPASTVPAPAVPAAAAAAPVSRDQPSRGLVIDRVPVHSVRLSGLVAHHEIIFASDGETLTIRHDSVSRASFMPGVLLAVRMVGRFAGLVTSLEELLRLANG